MKALVFKHGQLTYQDVPMPEVAEGEVLVKVNLVGICNTDLEICKGYMGFEGIPGHEFVGIVERGPAEWLGKRVVAGINCGCGTCHLCLKGMERHCPDRTVLGILKRNGAMAEYVTIPVGNLVAVPESVSDQAATFCEPIAAALEIVEQVHILPEYHVVVLGDGKLGALCAQVLNQTGAHVTCLGLSEKKLAPLAQLGIETCINKDINIVSDVVVECTGVPLGLKNALRIVKSRGYLVLKSTYHGDIQLDMSQIVINEISIVGSRCGNLEAAMRLLEKQRIETRFLIDRIFDFSEGLRAFELATDPKTRKILIRS